MTANFNSFLLLVEMDVRSADCEPIISEVTMSYVVFRFWLSMLTSDELKPPKQTIFMFARSSTKLHSLNDVVYKVSRL